jgi:hypothetical protein
MLTTKGAMQVRGSRASLSLGSQVSKDSVRMHTGVAFG